MVIAADSDKQFKARQIDTILFDRPRPYVIMFSSNFAPIMLGHISLIY